MCNYGVLFLWYQTIEGIAMSNAYKYGNNQSLASVLELFRQSVMYQLNCHQVGEIVSFDPVTQTAEVQIKMTKDQNDKTVEYPVLLDCPCVVLSGGAGNLTFPIKQGDSCLVLFNDRDIDNWYASGQKMNPRTPRTHNFSDAIALVGIRNKQNQLSGYLTDGTELKYGGSTIQLQDNKVTITNGTTQVQLSGGEVTITATTVNVVAPTATFSGAVTIAGAATISGGLTVQGKDIGPNHVHSGVSRGNSNTNGVV